MGAGNETVTTNAPAPAATIENLYSISDIQNPVYLYVLLDANC